MRAGGGEESWLGTARATYLYGQWTWLGRGVSIPWCRHERGHGRQGVASAGLGPGGYVPRRAYECHVCRGFLLCERASSAPAERGQVAAAGHACVLHAAARRRRRVGSSKVTCRVGPGRFQDVSTSRSLSSLQLVPAGPISAPTPAPSVESKLARRMCVCMYVGRYVCVYAHMCCVCRGWLTNTIRPGRRGPSASWVRASFPPVHLVRVGDAIPTYVW